MSAVYYIGYISFCQYCVYGINHSAISFFIFIITIYLLKILHTALFCDIIRYNKYEYLIIFLTQRYNVML